MRTVSHHRAYSSVETQNVRYVPSVRAERGLLRARVQRKPEREVQKNRFIGKPFVNRSYGKTDW